MSTGFTEVRGQTMAVDASASTPGADIVAGRVYVDTTTGVLYIYNGTTWRTVNGGTSTSTSTTSTSSSSTSTTSSSTSSSSSSTSSTSSSSSSSSTSTTLF